MAQPLLSQSDFQSEATRVVLDAERAYSVSGQWRNIFERTFELVIPERYSELQRNPDALYSKIWDSTAVESAQQLSNLLVSGLTPPWTPWFMLVPGPLITGDARVELRKSLHFVNQVLFLHLNLSNFVSEMQSTFLDCTLGTGAVAIQPHSRGIGVEFANIPIEQVAILRDSVGRLTHIFRTYEYPAQEFLTIKKFKEAVSEDFITKLQANVQQKLNVIDAVVLNDDGKSATKFFVLKTADTAAGNEPVMLDRKSMKRFPIKVPRWAPIPGQPYGRGPAMMGFGDIRSLNKAKELTLKNLAKEVAGIYTIRDDGVVNAYNTVLRPGSMIPVASNDQANPSIRPMPSSGRFDVAQFGIADLRESIKRLFLADQFSPIEGTKMSATEIAERGRVIAQNLGATYAGFQNDLLIPIVNDTLQILQSQNQLPAGVEIDRESVDIMFVSSIANAQRLAEVDAMLQFATISQSLSELDPRAGLVLDAEGFQRRIAELLAVDENLLRSSEDVERETDQAIQLLQAQQGEPNAGGQPQPVPAGAA